MARSKGITVSAIVVIIGSAFTIFCGAMMLLASILALNSSRASDAPVNLRYILVIEAFVAIGFGGWGLASSIGLIKTKEWARISTLVYAAILVFLSLPSAVAMAIIPFPNLPSAMTRITRSISCFWCASAGLSYTQCSRRSAATGFIFSILKR